MQALPPAKSSVWMDTKRRFFGWYRETSQAAIGFWSKHVLSVLWDHCNQGAKAVRCLAPDPDTSPGRSLG